MGNSATMNLRDVGSIILAIAAVMSLLTVLYWRLMKGESKGLEKAISGTKEAIVSTEGAINKRIDDTNSTISQLKSELVKVWETLSRSAFIKGNLAEEVKNIQSDTVEQHCKGKLSKPVITS